MLIPKFEFQLRMGELDITSRRGPRRLVETVITHPNFDRLTLEYDLALLRFNAPVVFQPNVSPICLPDSNETFIGRTAFVTGWGALKEAGGPLATTLQEVSLPVMDNTICEIMYKSSGYDQSIPNIFICAGLRNGGRDACQGDSGGPMVIQRPDKRFLLAGIASWGGVCGAPNEPGVYTRVSEFRHWIEEIINT
nr:serine proteinase stubble-like [Aedes albopictus]